MNAWPGPAVVSQLVRDTFRQAHASGIVWIMSAVTAVCVALCLSVSVTGDVSLRDDHEAVLFLPSASAGAASPAPGSPLESDPRLARREGIETVAGRMTLGFGAVSVPVTRERGDAVRFLELCLGGGVAGTFGLLLTLVWTAGFVPSFLEPGAAAVLLTKPVTRGQLLTGKCAGVLAFVGLQVLLFVGLTWLALGARTGVWDTAYLWCIPLLILQFAVYYGFSVMLAVLTRSTVVCAFGSVLFWLLAWGINYGAVLARGVSDRAYLPAPALALTEVAYWSFPKPIDAGLIVFNTLEAGRHFEKPAAFVMLESGRAFSPTLSLASSLLIVAFLMFASVHEFEAQDY